MMGFNSFDIGNMINAIFQSFLFSNVRNQMGLNTEKLKLLKTFFPMILKAYSAKEVNLLKLIVVLSTFSNCKVYGMQIAVTLFSALNFTIKKFI